MIEEENENERINRTRNGYFNNITLTFEENSVWETDEGFQIPQYFSVSCEFVHVGRYLPQTLGKHYEVPWLKDNGAGTGTAPGTTAANAGKPFLVTSQRDLVETFGEPTFYTDSNNNPIHAGELNEYGPQAAYSLLGVSNRAYVVRAGIDLAGLTASADAPTSNPANGTFWFDTAQTKYGIFQWNGNPASVTGGQSFTNKVPLVITSNTQLVGESNTGIPKGSVVVSGNLPSKDGSYSLYCAVIVKKVDEKTLGKVGINELLRGV